MSFDANRPDLTIGVLGAGAMGRGIAQVAATGGISVLLMDTQPGAAESAREFIAKMLSRAAEKGTLSQHDAVAAVARVKVVHALADFKPCHIVVEAVVENLDVKRQVFGELENIVEPDCILASNTSSLSITSIAGKLKTPERFAGMHFFNPVPLMRLIEVISGLRTEPWVSDALMEVGKRMTREPVRCSDVPGFLVNQVGRGFVLEASHLVQEGVAGFADVDRVMRDVAGFRLGPFELLDLTALDVSHPASESIYNQFFQEPRYRPSQLMRTRYEAGLLGRKTKKGFYDYDSEMKPVIAPEAPAPDARPDCVWVSSADPAGHRALTDLLKKLRSPLETMARPSDKALCLVTPVGEDTTSCSVAEGLDPRRTVAVDTLFSLDKRRTIMATPITDMTYRAMAHGLFASDGAAVTVCRDSPGFIAQRIVAMIANIGSSIAQNRTAEPADIDKAVKLGLNYPNGPLQFADVLGVGRIHRVLVSMHRIYGDPRYRPNVWLTRRAQLGVSALTPEP